VEQLASLLAFTISEVPSDFIMVTVQASVAELSHSSGIALQTKELAEFNFQNTRTLFRNPKPLVVNALPAANAIAGRARSKFLFSMIFKFVKYF
jgi:hypothetical protein